MKLALSFFDTSDAQEVIALYTRVFSASEGEGEGKSIGKLVNKLIATTQLEDLIGCVARVNNKITGCIFFSRLIVPGSQEAFLLSPVAIDTEAQGAGIGQQLIKHGLDYLRKRKVSLVFTYGDPNFYTKTGFRQISEDIVQAPCPLTQPVGWLAQSLDGQAIQAMSGKSQCVEALRDPVYW